MSVVFLVFPLYTRTMREVIYDETTAAVSDILLTTGEAARVLGVSRQHVVDLCDRGDLPYQTTGVHRRIRRADLEALRVQSGRLLREQRRTLWLGHAIAGKVVADPGHALDIAWTNLTTLRERHTRGQGRQWLDEWERLLDGPIEGVLRALTSTDPRSRELRANNPFAGLITAGERTRVLEAFTRWVASR